MAQLHGLQAVLLQAQGSAGAVGRDPISLHGPVHTCLGFQERASRKSTAAVLTISMMYPWESRASLHLTLLAKEVTGVHPRQGEGTQTHLLLGGWHPRKQKINFFTKR